MNMRIAAIRYYTKDGNYKIISKAFIDDPTDLTREYVINSLPDPVKDEIHLVEKIELL